MAKIKLFIQTGLNFLALNLLLNPIMNTLLPVSAVGGMLSLFYWGCYSLVRMPYPFF